MKLIFTSLLAMLCYNAMSQAKIVVLGSSTAAGFGALPFAPFDQDSGWVNRLRLHFNQNTSDALDTTVVNLAVGGYTTYHVMPTSYIPPPSRPAPDPEKNVTKAISLDPDVIIINLPSNDISLGFTKSEIMNNFRTLYQIINAAGINAFITTTQPRDFSPNLLMMEYQRDLKDSIQNNFAYFSINFWDDLVSTTPPNNLRPEVSYGDGVHINNLGHMLVFQRVAAKNLFVINAVLPIEMKSFEAKIQNKKTLLTWETLQEDVNTVFNIERSVNGIHYNNIGVVTGLSPSGSIYTFTDPNPIQGKSFYRIRMQGNSGTKYSTTKQVQHSNAILSIDKILVGPSSIQVHINSDLQDNLQVNLFASSGIRIEQKQQRINAPTTQVQFKTGHLPAGVYYLVISSGREFITKPVYLLK